MMARPINEKRRVGSKSKRSAAAGRHRRVRTSAVGDGEAEYGTRARFADVSLPVLRLGAAGALRDSDRGRMQEWNDGRYSLPVDLQSCATLALKPKPYDL